MSDEGVQGACGEGEVPDADDVIAAHIAAFDGWRGDSLAHIRRLIRTADPDVVEDLKWRKPSNPAGVLAWSHAGLVCTGEVYKHKVKFTFAKGASLADPVGLFNASLDAGVRRAIDLGKATSLAEAPFQALVRAAVAENTRAC
jgi:hypothetical protein